jgi:[acyl-carrier-protein] S-malonyltransferase
MTLAWLFPGQGTQTVGMGRALVERSRAARHVFDRADAALGFRISRLCFEGPEAELTLTANAQPAIVTTSIALLEALREASPDLPAPAFALGHSLGEYSALVASGALELEHAVKLVHIRGKAMQAAVVAGAGAMAAIMGGDGDAVRELCEAAAQGEVCQPANFNAPGQIVIAGHAGAIARAASLAAERKLKAIVLKVSAPFHCALMEPAARVLETALEQVPLRPLAFPVVSNVEAEPNTDPQRVPELLVRQVDSPVLFEQSVRRIQHAGVRRALEIGAGKVLAGLVRRIDKSIDVYGVSDPDGMAGAVGFVAGAANSAEFSSD